MQIDTARLRQLRAQRQWTQEQLADACSLNLRTIQRLEKSGKASMESVRALAAVFEIDAAELVVADHPSTETPIDAVRAGIQRGAEFSGTATRPEFWWLFLFVLLASALGQVIHDKLYLVVAIISLIPLLAAGTRRLRDAGHSGWWQLFYLVPFGFVPVLIMLALPGAEPAEPTVR